MTNPSLRLYLPPNIGTGFVEDFTGRAMQYRHRNAAMGGYWMAEWWMPLAPSRGLPADYLRQWFESRLMYKVIESGAGVTWEGVIWQMELSLDGLRRLKSMDRVWNAVQLTYTDESGQTQFTQWYEDAASIDRYGRRERVESATSLTGSQAVAEAQRILSESLWAMPETAGVDVPDEGLRVTAAGLVKTANNRYVTATTLDGTDKTLSTLITDIVNNDCDFLEPGIIESNSLTRAAMTTQPMRAWDLIKEICAASDSSNLPRFAQVYNGGRLQYITPNTEPAYRWYGKRKRFGDALGGDSTWRARPGVLRDMTGEAGAPPPGSWLADRRDTYIPEVEMAAGARVPELKPGGPDPERILRVKEQISRWLEMEAG